MAMEPVYALIEMYKYIFYDIRDPKVDSFPMTSNPFTTAGLCFFYLLIIQYIGPDLMAKRKPFDMRYILVGYNFIMVVINVWLHYEFWMAGWGTGYNFVCEQMDYDVNPRTMRMANLIWWYYITKFIDMFDTLFFVLRKQNDKITFLHFFHHFSMPMNIWVLLRYLPGGHCTFHGLLNSFVHAVMYFYYGIAALGPAFNKYRRWKKYVTMVQLIQFYLDCIHLAIPLFVDCAYSKLVLIYMLSQASVFLVLFTDFYIRAYTGQPKKTKPIANGHAD